jgi:gas vesicle protein
LKQELKEIKQKVDKMKDEIKQRNGRLRKDIKQLERNIRLKQDVNENI